MRAMIGPIFRKVCRPVWVFRLRCIRMTAILSTLFPRNQTSAAWCPAVPSAYNASL